MERTGTMVQSSLVGGDDEEREREDSLLLFHSG